MASNKTGITNTGGKVSAGLGGALLSILAAGIAGGALLIAGAKTVGDKLLEKQENDRIRLEEKRAADKEEVRRILENEADDE